jgi:hypothetical protein
METTRMRFGSILEWLLAATLIVAALAAGSIVFREVRTVRAVMPVIAGEAQAHEAPAGIPERAISVPMLLLGNGREVRLGDRASEVAARLGAAVQIVSESLDQTAVRERITRFYDALGTRFIVVFEGGAGAGDPRVAAIYLP